MWVPFGYKLFSRTQRKEEISIHYAFELLSDYLASNQPMAGKIIKLLKLLLSIFDL